MVATLRSEYPLPVLLQVANLARLTFYYQLGQMQAQDRHVKLKQVIRKIFDKSHQRYGYRWVRLQLLRDGWCVSRKLVAKLMRQLGLRSKTRKRKCYNSYRGTTSRRADNHLDRPFRSAVCHGKAESTMGLRYYPVPDLGAEAVFVSGDGFV